MTPLPSTGFAIDTSNRNEVISFYNAVYRAAADPVATLGWTGSYGSCAPGTLSPDYEEDVERRINFYRAMCGLEASAMVNTGAPVVIRPDDAHKPPGGTLKQAAAQQAALMFSFAGALTHSPPSGSPFACWSAGTWNAAARGNLALGRMGVDAIDAYMRENDEETLSIWDTSVGHRRWILMQGSTDFATGDVPGHPSGLQQANVLYVVQSAAETEAVAPRFVSWPSAGYFPDELMPLQWSVSRPGADFSTATVTMRRADGGNLPVTLIDRTSVGLGDPSIVFSPGGDFSAGQVAVDESYQIEIDGILINGETVAHHYTVTVMDIDRIDNPPDPVGTSNPPVSGATYYFEPVAEADQHRAVVLKSEPANWTEGAEDTSSGAIIDDTSGAYALRTAVSNPTYAPGNFWRSGAKAFRLTMPFAAAIVPEIFEIDREILPGPGCQIRYYVRRGFVVTGHRLELEISNDGSVWTSVDDLGGQTNSYDPNFVLRTVDIPESTGVFRMRFKVSRPPGSEIYDPTVVDVAGFFIDDISLSDAEWVTSSAAVSLAPPADRVFVDDAAVGETLDEGDEFLLRIEAVLGGRPYASRELKRLVVGNPLTGYALWEDAEFPILTAGFEGDDDGDGIANGIEFAFGLDPIEKSVVAGEAMLSGGQISLEQPLAGMRAGVTYGAEASHDLSEWSDVTVTHSDGTLRAQVPNTDEPTFLRWKIDEE